MPKAFSFILSFDFPTNNLVNKKHLAQSLLGVQLVFNE